MYPGRVAGQTPPVPEVTDEQYQQLLRVRAWLRRFLHWSEEQANAAGLSAAQHQLLLAVRGHPDPRGPTIGDVAGYLALRHHSVVGMVDRAVGAGLVERRPDPDDRRVVRLTATPTGARRLALLSAAHIDQLAVLATELSTLAPR
jgi:DNA-binding MarR family transcriptional regulator